MVCHLVAWFVLWWQPGLRQLDRYQSILYRVVIVGIHVHLGSTIMDVSVFSTLHRHIKQVTDQGVKIRHALMLSQVLARNHEHFMHVKIINLGGGLGIDYTHKGQAPR